MTSAKLHIKGFPTTVRVPFTENLSAQEVLNQLVSRSAPAPQLSLRLKHIRGFDVFPIIDVYLNAENGPYPESLLLGSLALYGLRNSSVPGPSHPGVGMHEAWEVGEAFNRANRLHNWSDRYFTLTFDSALPFPEGTELTVEGIELYWLRGEVCF